MQFRFGYHNTTTVEVTNRQQYVEYKIINGSSDEKSIRSAVGNTNRTQYEYDYRGYYHERNGAIDRLQKEIKKTKQKLEMLEFALKVTKKKNWKSL